MKSTSSSPTPDANMSSSPTPDMSWVNDHPTEFAQFAHSRKEIRERYGDNHQICGREIAEALALRQLQYSEVPISSDMMARQEEDILMNFRESDIARADLAEAYLKQEDILILFGKASLKESKCRKLYAKRAKESAAEDAKSNDGRLYEEWVLRIYCDELVVSALNMHHAESMQNDIQFDRTKFAFDINRCKAILKADKRAVKSAWPKIDFTPLRESIMKAHRVRSSTVTGKDMFHYFANDRDDDSDYEDQVIHA